MTGPLMVLAGCCLLIGLAPLVAAPVLDHAVRAWAPEIAARSPSLKALAPLGWISAAGLALIALCVVASLVLGVRLRRYGATSAGTWDCGYAAPAPTMQYTASSFSQMLVGFFAWVLRPRVDVPVAQGLFWEASRYRSEVPDVVLDSALRPGFRFSARLMSSFRLLQAGSIHAYLFYIVAFLIVLLLWR